MSLGNQMRALQRSAAAFRQEAFGTKTDGTPVTVDYNSGEFPLLTGYYSPIKTRQQTEQAGFLDMHDAIVRVIKASYPAFAPTIDAPITIKEGEAEIALRINEIAGTHPLSPEWVLGCKAQN